MTMVRRSKPTADGTAKLALALIDLRAHFEAQLRTVVRAEETLLKCRGAHDAATFDTAAATFRVVSMGKGGPDVRIVRRW